MKSTKKSKKTKKRLGRVMFSISYVVDLDNKDMVDEAKDCLYEDIFSIVKDGDLYNLIKVCSDKKLKESDIPEFLLAEEESSSED